MTTAPFVFTIYLIASSISLYKRYPISSIGRFLVRVFIQVLNFLNLTIIVTRTTKREAKRIYNSRVLENMYLFLIVNIQFISEYATSFVCCIVYAIIKQFDPI